MYQNIFAVNATGSVIGPMLTPNIEEPRPKAEPEPCSPKLLMKPSDDRQYSTGHKVVSQAKFCHIAHKNSAMIVNSNPTNSASPIAPCPWRL